MNTQNAILYVQAVAEEDKDLRKLRQALRKAELVLSATQVAIAKILGNDLDSDLVMDHDVAKAVWNALISSELPGFQEIVLWKVLTANYQKGESGLSLSEISFNGVTLFALSQFQSGYQTKLTVSRNRTERPRE